MGTVSFVRSFYSVSKFIWATKDKSFFNSLLATFQTFSMNLVSSFIAINSVCLVQLPLRGEHELCQRTILTVSDPSAKKMQIPIWECLIKIFWRRCLYSRRWIEFLFRSLKIRREFFSTVASLRACFVPYRIRAGLRGLSRFICSSVLPEKAYLAFVHVLIHANFSLKHLNLDTCSSDMFFSKSSVGVFGKNSKATSSTSNDWSVCYTRFW